MFDLLSLASLVMAEVAWCIRCVLLTAFWVTAGLTVLIDVALLHLLIRARRRSHLGARGSDRILEKAQIDAFANRTVI